MIETAEGVDNVDEIAATPGLDGIYIGPSDLALAIGLAPRGDNDDPAHVKTVRLIHAACRKQGVAIGIQASASGSPGATLNSASTSSPWVRIWASCPRAPPKSWPRHGVSSRGKINFNNSVR